MPIRIMYISTLLLLLVLLSLVLSCYCCCINVNVVVRDSSINYCYWYIILSVTTLQFLDSYHGSCYYIKQLLNNIVIVNTIKYLQVVGPAFVVYDHYSCYCCYY